MLAKLASLLFMALLGLLLFGLLLWWLQPRMIFFPSERLGGITDRLGARL